MVIWPGGPGTQVEYAGWERRLCAHRQQTVTSQATCALTHDGVVVWKHFPKYWPFVRGIHWSLVDWEVFFITGPLWGESTGPGGFPSQRASDIYVKPWWSFLCCQLEWAVEQTLERSVIWDAISALVTSMHPWASDFDAYMWNLHGLDQNCGVSVTFSVMITVEYWNTFSPFRRHHSIWPNIYGT